MAEQPRYGYQIEQDIAARGFREWTEIGFSSIYYVLNKLESTGWLVSEHGQNTVEKIPVQTERERRGGPTRRVYHLTQAGWIGYHDAVLERLAHPRPRTGDFDLALANLPALSPEEARSALETYRTALQQRLSHIRAKWTQDRAAAEDRSSPPGSLPSHVDALFSHSIAALEAELRWVDSFLSAQPPSSRITG